MHKKSKFVLEDGIFDEAANSYSKYMELVEAFDWDEDAAVELFEEAFKALVDLYEYSKYDQSLIKNNEQFVKLYRANIKTEMSDKQFEIVYNLIDHKIKESATAIAKKQERS